LNELGKAGISLGSDGIPVLLKSSPSDDEQSSERDADDEEIEVNAISLVSTSDEIIREKVILKTENFDRYEDVICFQPRATTAASYTENSSPVNSTHVSLDCLQSLNSRKDDGNSNKNINDVGDTDNSLRNVLVQKISEEKFLFEKKIESQFRNGNENVIPSVQTDAEKIYSHDNGALESSDILQNVLSTNFTQGKADENVLQDIPIGSVNTNSIEDQLTKPKCDFKSDQISEISISQSVERSKSNSNFTERVHLQHDSNTQNGSDNCDEHVMKCHRISSFNELHGSVTAFRSDMSRSSDSSDNCAVVSLSDNDDDGGDGDSNNQSSDRDGESPPPSLDTPPITLHNNHVYVAAVKPESRSMMNLAIAIDDFPPPL
jgi:hypothetical protein